MTLTMLCGRSAGAVPGCQVLDVAVALSGSATGAMIHGELCAPAGATAVHLLVTPVASNLRVWDPPAPPLGPYAPERYSYVRALTEAGYATLSIDPLGAGQSSHPLSALVTFQAYVDEVHEIVQDLRAGKIGGHRFSIVLADGWSNSSVAAADEAGRYHDVDGLALQGMSFPPNFNLGVYAAEEGEPAAAEPKFARMGLDPGYLTLRARFYQHDIASPDGYDPRALAAVLFDQDTLTAEYSAGFAFKFASLANPGTAFTRTVTAPVLLGMGSEDAAFCKPPDGTDCSTAATVRAANAPLYPSAPRFDTFVLPRSGHAMNLALDARDWFDEVVTWSKAIAPPS